MVRIIIVLFLLSGCAHGKVDVVRHSNSHVSATITGIVSDTKTTWYDNGTLQSFETISKDKPEENIVIRFFKTFGRLINPEISPEIKLLQSTKSYLDNYFQFF